MQGTTLKFILITSLVIMYLNKCVIYSPLSAMWMLTHNRRTRNLIHFMTAEFKMKRKELYTI